MSTKQSTIDYIADQLSGLRDVSTRKMFGEYALYYKNKVVALVCDDTLFIKMTDQGKDFVGDLYKEGQAYPGSKMYMVIDGDQIEDHEWLGELVQITFDSLPEPKKKKR